MESTMVAPAWSSPVRVRDVLPAALPALGDGMLEEAIRTAWGGMVGALLGRRSRPGRLRRGVLDVSVDNSAGLQEITLRSGEVLAALQCRFGSAIASLRFSLGEVPAEVEPVRLRPRPESPARLSREETREVETMVASLRDPALADSLRRLLVKDLLARRRHGSNPRPGDPLPPEREDS